MHSPRYDAVDREWPADGGRDVKAGVGFDWGIAGARAAAEADGADGALVVVDVLSFSTAVTIATGRGTAVYPQPWPPGDVASFAAARGAVLATRRDEVSERRP